MPRRRLIEMRRLRQTRLIDSMNSWVGSWGFLVIHVVWFIIWLAWQWDINMLTMIVSLEAIILMILLLMAQNRLSIRDDLRDEADLQADLQSVGLSEKVLREVKEIKREISKLQK
ncbi:MAG: hypothetical protein COV55_00260 [Candidatus Komeilibacteria bacterium CG11_big_fil_rev_8_21_14_0_20_36_20]|uniref:DUF1003 domain-containing protein n=1 Tax=Candidatus Komeilibacteria bacterium CG11_big_fil_rev_8_21_14_0_20_36_20 TaxID=1974477 RepID=A0A2H0NEK3_9BACT|nr:MAG: hypothetical protein COV55_00260 [Candidatus Komeilibacteria bacterium CG11_big_fil_rev_8_21_14_0_20_36_20]PIR81546.1 MAG: hypothetical protein COU21_03150 [Candidatus Komeilibacteria bacterium CG10_big_fil_rev_8_21_14_0_10_36_65]PJC55454.1 MAG: hypothetical protein CO027_01985 [Candidatus Komeilibacteria bacterium CG_4_9_14_0_2_um_filter_36_13]